MILSDDDRKTAVWQKIEKYLNTRLETHRKKNDNDIDPVKTAKLRGQIVEIKVLLGKTQDSPGAE